MQVVFWGRQHRTWNSSDGPRDFFVVTVLTEDGGAGQLRVTREVFDSVAGVKQGDPVALKFGLQPYKGNMEPRVVGIHAAAAK